MNIYQKNILNKKFKKNKSFKRKERWPSGLRRTLGKCVYPHRYRGFESHSLRHKFYLFIENKRHKLFRLREH